MGLFDGLSGLAGGDASKTAAGESAAPVVVLTDGGRDSGREVDDVSTWGPAELRAEAEEFAADHEDDEFDFTVESLERLDEYATSQTQILDMLDDEVDGLGDLHGNMRKGYTLWFGSYFGEVLVREFDGEWAWNDDGVAVEIPVGAEVVEVPVFDAALAAVFDEPRFAEVTAEVRDTIESIRDARASTADTSAVEEMSPNESSPDAPAAVESSPGASGVDEMPPGASGVDEMSPGASGVDEMSPGASGVDEMSPGAHDVTEEPTTLREQVQQEAQELVEFWPQADLDYSVESLSRLDDRIDETWEKDRFDDAEYGGESVSDLAYTGIIRWAGSYFGEVLVRTLDAEWVQDGATAVEVEGPEGTATVNVFHIADDCLSEPSKFAFTYETAKRSVHDGDF